MKVEIASFPVGMAEGLPVLHLDFEGGPWSTEAAEAHRARHGGARGLWGVWLDGLETWEAPEIDAWIDEQPRVVSLRKIGATDWPAAELFTILDVTAAMEHATDIDALADFVAARSSSTPEIFDVVAELGEGQRAPLSGAFDLIADFAQAQGYIYTPADHPHRPLVLRAITQCASVWALRTT